MIIRKGKTEDINDIMNLIKAAVVNMQLNELDQWDDIYPNKEVIEADIREENLYVYEDNRIKGIIVLNEDQDEEYKAIKWEYTLGVQLVIHRLCVHPEYSGKGIARKLMDYAEKYCVENRHNAIRLDAFIKNDRACRMYEQAGYKKVGVVTFRKGDFYCYEKEFK